MTDQASKKTVFTVDLIWCGSLRLTPITAVTQNIFYAYRDISWLVIQNFSDLCTNQAHELHYYNHKFHDQRNMVNYREVVSMLG